jgi:hypothetical protein
MVLDRAARRRSAMRGAAGPPPRNRDGETEAVPMSFDALTIAGTLLALLSGGFLLGLVAHDDRDGR